MDTPQAGNITVIPTGAALGADVVGVDLSKPITAETFKQIEDAWHTHLVLRFRGQQLDDPAARAACGVHGRSRAMTSMTWDHVAGRTETAMLAHLSSSPVDA